MHLLGLGVHVERSEGSGVFRESTLDGCQFGNQAFDAVANRHTRGDAVRVYDHIRDDAFNGEGQILLSVCHPARSLLAVSGCELIAYLRNPHTADAHFGEFVASGIL